MTPADTRAIVFELFPRKVSAPADESPRIIGELRAFWQFLDRAFKLKNAPACLKVFDAKATEKLAAAMKNPANFGFAKAIVMMGAERGYDMTSEKGINEWMKKYNEEVTSGALQPPELPGMPFSNLMPGGIPRRKADKVKKARRKMRQASRRKNQKRK